MRTIKKVADYRIINEATSYDLQENVKRLLSEGWQVHGDTYMQLYQTDRANYTCFCQAMIFLEDREER